MEMEVVVAVPPPPPIPMDFNFDSNCSSPYMTAPSSPQRFGNFFCSAPTSPTRVSSFFHQLNNNLAMPRHSSADSSPPLQWQEEEPKPHSQPTTTNNSNDENEDFEFNFSGHLERPSLSADELFDGGKIRPLKLTSTENSASSTRHGKKIVDGASHNKRDSDPFAEESSTRKRGQEEGAPEKQQKRGRERDSSSTTCRKGSRSMSPLRNNSDIACEGVSSSTSNTKTSATFSSFLSSISLTKGYRKWRLKDFLLFRSASEGRATDKDPLRRKYEVLTKRAVEEDVRNSSFRSTESSGSVSRRRGPVSAHELHYTMNRAASVEMKKKTMLPYKQGLLGCLGFNPGVHQISRGIGSLARS